MEILKTLSMEKFREGLQGLVENCRKFLTEKYDKTCESDIHVCCEVIKMASNLKGLRSQFPLISIKR